MYALEKPGVGHPARVYNLELAQLYRLLFDAGELKRDAPAVSRE